MIELCRMCKYFDETKVEDNMYFCPKVNLTLWYELDVYAGCGGFEEKE